MLFAALLAGFLAGSAPADSRATAAVQPAGSSPNRTAVAELRPLEVRIRKLHVLRPDLLRYPMQYDIYC